MQVEMDAGSYPATFHLAWRAIDLFAKQNAMRAVSSVASSAIPSSMRRNDSRH